MKKYRIWLKALDELEAGWYMWSLHGGGDVRNSKKKGDGVEVFDDVYQAIQFSQHAAGKGYPNKIIPKPKPKHYRNYINGRIRA